MLLHYKNSTNFCSAGVLPHFCGQKCEESFFDIIVGMQSDNLCTIYVVRHGETDWNVQRLTQGHTDIPLNSNGEIQAKELGEELKDIQFDFVFSSDLQRAKRTAEIIVLEKKLAVQTTKALRERTWGSMEGKSVDENSAVIKKLLANLNEAEIAAFKIASDVESDDELMGRILTFLREIAVGYPNKNVLVVSHGGVIRTLYQRLSNVEFQSHLHIENGAYVKLESDGVDFFVKDTKGITAR